MISNFNGTGQIKKGLQAGEIVGFALGVILFSVSIYAFNLSIKANKMTIKKLKDEGYN